MMVSKPSGTARVICGLEDHLSIVTTNTNVEKAFKECKETLDLVAKKLNFVKHPKYGYLSVWPSNCGSGIRISCNLGKVKEFTINYYHLFSNSM